MSKDKHKKAARHEQAKDAEIAKLRGDVDYLRAMGKATQETAAARAEEIAQLTTRIDILLADLRNESDAKAELQRELDDAHARLRAVQDAAPPAANP